MLFHRICSMSNCTWIIRHMFCVFRSLIAFLRLRAVGVVSNRCKISVDTGELTLTDRHSFIQSFDHAVIRSIIRPYSDSLIHSFIACFIGRPLVVKCGFNVVSRQIWLGDQWNVSLMCCRLHVFSCEVFINAYVYYNG